MPIDIKDLGAGNVYRLDADSFEAGAELTIRGNDNTVEIGADVDLRAPRIHVEGDANRIRLAAGPFEVDDERDPRLEEVPPFLLHADTREAEIVVLGDGNTIEAGRYAELYDSSLQVVGDDNLLRLGSRVRAHLKVDFHTSGACLDIGDRTTAVALQAALHEPRTLRLGKDCQLAAAIYITVSDTHSIVDLDTGEPINAGQDVVIGDHVWLGYRAVVLKGAKIGSGSVVGTCAVVTSEIPENCVAVGNPARVVRRNVTWTRELLSTSGLKAVGSS